MLKKTLFTLTALMTIFWSVTCAAAEKANNWLIYWYVCGTDIETTRIAFGTGTDLMSDDPNKLILAEPNRAPGDVTRCIKEVESANLSSNVKIFMQAGGTYIWGHEKFRDLNAKIQTALTYEKDNKGELVPINVYKNPSVSVYQWFLTGGGGNTVAKPVQGGNGKIGRYVYDRNHRNWVAREKLPISGVRDSETDMGSKVGLVSFLRAGQKLEQELYPEGNVRRILILKDHGGPTQDDPIGICIDEYTKSIIHLDAMQQAFEEVQNGWSNPDEKPFEIIAFDACEMSDYETAMAIKDVANYMVASQETAFGKVGLNYTDLLNELSKNPSMDGKQLGKVICNTRWVDSKNTDKEFGTNMNNLFTFSVVDLSGQKMDALKTAYEDFNAKTISVAKENAGVIHNFTKFKNAVNISEKYPSYDLNAPLVDLKNFTDNLNAVFPELKDTGLKLIKAIDDAVVYNKRGNVLNRGGGLSTYSQSEAYQILRSSVEGQRFNIAGLREKPVEVDEENKTAVVELSEDELSSIDSVRYQRVYIVPHNDGTERMDVMFLGSESNVAEDSQGTFKVTFNNNKWYMLNGNPLYVQVVADATRKNKNGKKISGNDICISPILINGEPYKLFFSRSYPNEKITIIGVISYKNSNRTALPSGNWESFKKGDVVMPLYFNLKAETIENSKPFETMTNEEQNSLIQTMLTRGKSIIIGDNPKIEMRNLSDGFYGYLFEFVNPINDQRNVMTNDGVICKVKNGKIVKVKHFNDIDNLSDLEN